MSLFASLRKTKTGRARVALTCIAACIAAGVFAFFPPAPAHAYEQTYPVDLYLFWSSGCPHCAKERYFISKLDSDYELLSVHEYEVSTSQANAELLLRIGKTMEVSVSGVPFTVVGNRTFSGFYTEETTGKVIREAILQCMESGCDDVVGGILGKPNALPAEIPAQTAPSAQSVPTEQKPAPENVHAEAPEPHATNGYLGQSVQEHPVPETVNLPALGTIKLKNISLPIITVIFGALDGFNPCAMWVLLFLISLLIHMENRKRMWALGATFIAASAFVYFFFMAAWLNVLLFIGFVFWIRAAIATLAIAAGGYHIHGFITKPESGCEVVSDERRERIFSRIRKALGQRAFLFVVIGMIGLAFAVNLIELLCSAGLPVVYTQILAMTNLAAWQYYAYLLLYVFIFMLDDLVIFIIAVSTLRMVGITTKYTRVTHLAGGLVMIMIGLLLFLKPEWLMFG